MFAHRALVIAQLILCTSAAWAASGPSKEAHKAFSDGLKFEAAKQRERAIQAFSEAIQAAPDYVEAYEHRAALRMASGYPAQAI